MGLFRIAETLKALISLGVLSGAHPFSVHSVPSAPQRFKGKEKR
jgi:hypothetical protein